RHTRFSRDWSSDVCSSDLKNLAQNAHCVVCTDNAAEAVIVEGVARKIATLKSKRPFFAAYEPKYKWDMGPYQNEPVYRVRPLRKIGRASCRERGDGWGGAG